MNPQNLTIDVQVRKTRGKHNKILRKNKQVPAVVYGIHQDNLSISLDIRQAEKYYKKIYDNKILTFKSEDKKLNGLKVIRKEVSIDKIKRHPIHIDFLALDMKVPIRIPIEVAFKGTPKGVKEEGGIFNIILRTIEIECLPNKIPESLTLDVSRLNLNEAIHVSDLQISEDIKLVTKKTRTLCTVVSAEEEKAEEKSAEGEVTASSKSSEGAASTTTESNKKEEKSSK